MREIVRQQGFAVLCVAVATALRFCPGVFWPDILVYAAYYPAVLIATLVCGVPAGVTATHARRCGDSIKALAP